MGGNAIMQKGFNSTRVDKKTYDNIKNEVSSILKDEVFEIPPEFSDKESFGDIDVVIQHNGSEHISDVYDKFIETGKIDGVSKNKTIYSLAYNMGDNKHFQIDLIFVSKDNFEGSVNYLSFGDMFNILGRISKRIGAKLSHSGFEYIVRANDKVVGEVILTRDFRKIFDILGLDYDYFKSGLGDGTQKDMFEFVISSKYFTMDSFNSEKFTVKNTKRKNTRPGFKAFLDYLEAKEELKFYTVLGTTKDDVLEFFPEKLEQVNKLKHIADMREKASKLFNGNIVKEVLNIEGKELGEFMKKFKSAYSVTDIVKMNDSERIENAIKNTYSKM